MMPADARVGDAQPWTIACLQEAAVAVLEAERVALARCVWLQSKPLPVPLVGVSAVLVECERAVDDVAADILRLVSVPSGSSRRT